MLLVTPPIFDNKAYRVRFSSEGFGKGYRNKSVFLARSSVNINIYYISAKSVFIENLGLILLNLSFKKVKLICQSQRES